MNLKNTLVALLMTGFGSIALASSNQSLGLKLGIGRGGLIIGGEYEVIDTSMESFLGFATLHSKDSANYAPGILAFGGAFKLRLVQGPYELFIAPGMGVYSYDNGENDLLIGPRLSTGLSAKLDEYMALGIENEKLYSWLGEVKGPLMDSFLIFLNYML